MTQDTTTEAVERLAKEYDERVEIFDGIMDATPSSVRELRRERNSATRQQHVDTAATLRALAAERDRLAALLEEYKMVADALDGQMSAAAKRADALAGLLEEAKAGLNHYAGITGGERARAALAKMEAGQ